MAFPLIFIGLLLIIVAARDKTEEFQTLLADDFFGNDASVGFLGWIIAVLAISAIGSFKPLKGLSDGFLALIAIVLLVGSNQSFFSEFQKQALQK